MNGVERIAKERERQVKVEDWTAAHDDGHEMGEMAMAAACYATPERLYRLETHAKGMDFVDPWPDGWEDSDKRPHPDDGNFVGNNAALSIPKRIRQLEKAGALVAAEIDRLLRLS